MKKLCKNIGTHYTNEQIKWFTYDLRLIIRQTRKMGRIKDYLALRPKQRENLVQTMQDFIDELGRIKGMCEKGK